MKSKVTKERDSYALKYRDMKQKQTQYHNKYLQTEKMCSALKDKLQRALNDKGMKKSGMGILNAIPKNTVKQDVMNSSIIQALEDDYEILLKENEEMRKSFKRLNEEMEEIRIYFEGKTTSTYKIHPGMFELPFESVKDSLEEYFHEKLESILELIELDKENEITLKDLDNGTYKMIYYPSKIGKHKFDVKVNGVKINGKPFLVNVLENSHLKTPIILQREMMIKLCDENGEIIQEESNLLKVKFETDKGEKTKNIAINKKYVGEGIHKITFLVLKSGSYKISVLIENEHITNSPFMLNVK